MTCPLRACVHDPLELRGVWFLEGRKMAHWAQASRERIAAESRRLSVELAPHIPRSCTHVRGHGGVKSAVRMIHRRLSRAPFVARFDIAAYYTSLRHDVLLGQLLQAQLAPQAVALVRDYLRLPDLAHTGRGLVASGSLSPLLAAVYLIPLDRAMRLRERRGQLLGYVRFMDDLVLLAKTRWQLRRAIAELHRVLAPLGLRLHRVKRFIGRAKRGFDFLGYQFHPGRKLRPSRESLRRLRERARRLIERGAEQHRLRQYVTRWQRWLFGGLEGLVSRQGGTDRTWHHVLMHLALARPP